MIINLMLAFVAGFILNIVSNLESFYSYVKIKSFYGAIIGFIYLMLTGLIFVDIVSYSEGRFWLIFMLALGGALGNFTVAVLLNRKRIAKKLAGYKKVSHRARITRNKIRY